MKIKSRERLTRRWREMDSNLQFRAKWAAASRLLRDDQARLSGGEAGVAAVSHAVV
jgi:hypothetical protein